MKNNKGFVGLGLILAIIIVLAVGGGAYYLGTKNDSVPKNTEVNLPTENQNNNPKLEVPTGPFLDETNYVPPKPISCNSNTNPWIQVLSPNGGETYTAGQQITVKWKSCNLPSLDYFFIALHKSGDASDGLDWENVVYLDIINDSNEIFTLPSNASGKYKIRIGSAVATIGQDFSDNFFTIKNSLQSSLDMTNQYTKTYKTLFTTEFAKPANFDTHFRTVSVGCGTACMYLYALDKNNGKVYKVSAESFSDFSLLDNQIRATLQNGQKMIYIFNPLEDKFQEWAV